MINDIKQALALKLKELYPFATIYDEDVPQNFKKPSFLISIIDQDYNKRLDNKYSSLLSFDIAYFSDKKVVDIKADCIDKQIAILRAFDLADKFRIINKSATIEDNVLHITFNIQYSEMKVTDEVKMRTKETELKGKGD